MRRLLAIATLALLAGCTSPSPYENAELGGTVTYPQKIAYGPDATLVVWLVDASGPESPIEVDLQKLDNPAPGTELLAATTFEGRIVSPTPFALPVPLAKIDQGHSGAAAGAGSGPLRTGASTERSGRRRSPRPTPQTRPSKRQTSSMVTARAHS